MCPGSSGRGTTEGNGAPVQEMGPSSNLLGHSAQVTVGPSILKQEGTGSFATRTKMFLTVICVRRIPPNLHTGRGHGCVNLTASCHQGAALPLDGCAMIQWQGSFRRQG